MAIELRWDDINDKPVLVYEFYQGWSWEDFHDAKQRADALLETSSIKIALLFDMRRASDMPPGMLKHTQTFVEKRNMNGSPIIVIGASSVVRTTFSIVKRMVGQLSQDLMTDVQFIQDWEDVPKYLRHYRHL